MAFIQLSVYSKTLCMDMPVSIIWSGYQREHVYLDEPDYRFVAPELTLSPRKVIWLYHGGSGDQLLWTRYTNCEQYLRKHNIIAIAPNVHNSCYMDMAHGGKYARYVGWELPRVIRTLFPGFSSRREDNYIAGFSNGGYGAFHIGLMYPEAFCAIGAFSAEDIGNGRKNLQMRDGPLFYDAGDEQARLSASIAYQARILAAKDGPKPFIYHTAGDSEVFTAGNRELRDVFSSIPGDPYRYKYEEFPGYGHEFPVWDMSIEKFLDMIDPPAK